MSAPNPSIERELIHICGDVPDPTAKNSGIRGDATHYDLAAGGRIGQPRVLYRSRGGAEFVMTVDVYQHEGAPLEVILLCPQCQHSLRVSAERKKIEYDRDRDQLHIETFQCTWELDTTKPVGLMGKENLCGWRAAIEPLRQSVVAHEEDERGVAHQVIVKNVARDA